MQKSNMASENCALLIWKQRGKYMTEFPLPVFVKHRYADHDDEGYRQYKEVKLKGRLFAYTETGMTMRRKQLESMYGTVAGEIQHTVKFVPNDPWWREMIAQEGYPIEYQPRVATIYLKGKEANLFVRPHNAGLMFQDGHGGLYHALPYSDAETESQHDERLARKRKPENRAEDWDCWRQINLENSIWPYRNRIAKLPDGYGLEEPDVTE